MPDRNPFTRAPWRAAVATLASAALLVVGCGGDEEADGPAAPMDPYDLIQAAAAERWEQKAVEIRLRASGEGSYTYAGALEPQRGRFKVEPGEQSPAEEGFGAAETVIGLTGEGSEGTVAVVESPGPPFEKGGLDGPCWFNPHSTVGGGMGTISVEEAARVSGAIVESLAEGEIDTVEPGGGGRYDVRLAESAAFPRDDFKDRPERVWGSRRLLGSPFNRTEVIIEDGRLTQVVLRIQRYNQPYSREAIRNVRLVTKLGSPTERLDLEPPPCQAIE